MRTILYIANQVPAKSETFIYNEIEYVQHLKDVRVIVLTYQQPDLRFRSIANWNHFCVKNPLFGMKVLFQVIPLRFFCNVRVEIKDLFYLAAARYLVRKYSVNHVHTHWPRPSYTGYLLAHHFDIPWTMSVHAHEVKYENRYYNLILDKVKRISFCNSGAMNLFRTMFEIEEDKTVLNYHGTDIERFNYMPSNSMQILSIGRLAPSKGFNRIVSIAESINHQKTNSWEFTVIGEGNEEIEKFLNSSQYVTLRSWMSPEKLAEYYKRSAILMMLPDQSGHDGIPNVIFEAMSCGKIVVVSNLDGISELVSDGVNGFVVDVDEHCWQDKVLDILGRIESLSKNQLNEISLKASHTIKSRFSSEKCLKEFVETILL